MATYDDLECHTLRDAIPPIARADIAILLLELCEVDTDHLFNDTRNSSKSRYNYPKLLWNQKQPENFSSSV